MKKRILPGRVFGIALVLVTIHLLLPSSPVQAQDAYISLSRDHGVPGAEVTVYGYNPTPDEWVDIYYYLNDDRVWVADVEVAEDGDFRVAFIIPESYRGNHEVLAEDMHAVSASVYFTVEPGLAIDPEEGPVGTTVTVEGHGFAEDEVDIELMYYYAYDILEVVADDIEADGDGWWEQDFVLPPSAKGSHKIDAQGDDSQLYEVQDASFSVIPSISLDKSSGRIGETVTVVGTGFEADERDITILFAGEEAETEITIIRASENGCWEASFMVPEMPAGTYSVAAEGESTPKEDIAALRFLISPACAPAGKATPMVAAGLRHTVGLEADGTVVAVGWNEDGQCDVGKWNLITGRPPVNWPLFGGIIAAVIALGLVFFFVRRRGKGRGDTSG